MQLGSLDGLGECGKRESDKFGKRMRGLWVGPFACWQIPHDSAAERLPGPPCTPRSPWSYCGAVMRRILMWGLAGDRPRPTWQWSSTPRTSAQAVSRHFSVDPQLRMAYT